MSPYYLCFRPSSDFLDEVLQNFFLKLPPLQVSCQTNFIYELLRKLEIKPLIHYEKC
jgi:hypothetical protein